jgi:hypothetical protein
LRARVNFLDVLADRRFAFSCFDWHRIALISAVCYVLPAAVQSYCSIHPRSVSNGITQRSSKRP